MPTDTAPSLPVLLVCACDVQRRALAEHLEAINLEVAGTSDFDAAITTVVQTAAQWAALTVFLDDLLDRDTVLETLRNMRHLIPNLPVIVICTQQSHDIFGLEALDLCDVKLRTPLRRDSLQNAMLQAQLNNRMHQTRAMQPSL